MTTSTPRLVMEGPASGIFTYGTTKRTNEEAFTLLKDKTSEIRKVDSRVATLQFSQAQALLFIKEEGLALTIVPVKERGGRGGTAFSTFYVKYLHKSESEVNALIAWALVVRDIGTQVPQSHARALVSVPPTMRRSVLDKAIALGKGKGATKATIETARKDLGVRAVSKAPKPKVPPAPPAPPEPTSVGIVEGCNLLVMALKAEGHIELSKNERSMVSALIQGLQTLIQPAVQAA